MKKQNKLCRTLSALIAVIMVLSCLPVLSGAVPPTSGPFKVTDKEGNVTYGFYKEEWGGDKTYELATVFDYAPEGSTVQLTRNLDSVSGAAKVNGGHYVLDLNGYVISTKDGSYFLHTNDKGSLTIIDSNPAAEHKYVVGEERWTWNDSAVPGDGCSEYTYEYCVENDVALKPGDVVILKGGAVIGSTGHGIDVNAGTALTLESGNIVGFPNGGIFQTGSTVIMNGGNICGNGVATVDHSGGITAINKNDFISTMIINGGTICYNKHVVGNTCYNTTGGGGVGIVNCNYEIDDSNAVIKNNTSPAMDPDSFPDWVYTDVGKWYKRYDNDYSITKNSTPVSYKNITYKYGNDIIAVAGAPTAYKIGTGISVAEWAVVTPSLPTGMKFAGWFTESDGGTKVRGIAAGENNDITVYAHFVPTGNTVELDIIYMNGTEAVTVPGAPAVFQEGIGISSEDWSEIIPAAPEGMQFDGWFTKSAGGTQVSSIDASVNTNVVVYAHFSVSVNLTFTTSTCGGYISNDNEATKTPIVGFGYIVDQPDEIENITAYGVYVYNTAAANGIKAELNGGSTQDLLDNDGRFYAYVTSGTPIRYYSIGYATVNGTTYYSQLCDDIGNYESYLIVD